MGILEQINDLKNQGIPDNEIISELKNRGVPPKEINEALNQSKIKNAVSGNSQEYPEQNMQKSMMPQQRSSQAPRTQELENPEGYYNPNPEGEYNPQTPPAQNEYDQRGGYYEEAPSPGLPETQNYPPQGQYYEEYPDYGGEDYGGSYGGADEFIEIAEQVFNEKIKEMEKKVDELGEIKSIAGIRLDHMSERVKRMESAFDKLQAAILNKVGSYGNTLDSIKKEMSMLGDSFGKIAKTTGTIKKAPTKKKTSSKKKTTKKRKTKKKK